jgi:hypothetical protein
MGKKAQNIMILVVVVIAVAIGSFFSGRAYFYKDAYLDGVVFADSSSYKRGRTEGYKAGYEYCDSLTEVLDSLRKTEMFNLNIIFEELADPKKYIKVSGTIQSRSMKDGIGSRKERFVKALIVNTASFARYNELAITARFKDKREKAIGDFNFKLPDVSLSDVLYPRKNLDFEIGGKDIPALAESVEFIVESAQGMD